MQFSLRELFVALLYIAVGLSALRLGGIFAAVVITASALVLMATAILGIIGTGVSRAGAVGFMTPATSYWVMLLVAGPQEYDPNGAYLPLSRLVGAFHNLMAAQTNSYAGMGLYGGGMSMGTLSMYPVVPLDVWTFMVLGHCVIAAILGFFGRQFAKSIYFQQHQNKTLDEPSDARKSPVDCDFES